MANDKKRMISTHFWNDNFTAELDPIEKLLFLYILTNDQTNMLGIYELPIRRIAFDTGIDKDMILKIMQRYKDAEKAEYLDGYVIIYNFCKHQSYNKNMISSAIQTANDLPDNIKASEGYLRVVQGFETHAQGLKTLDKGFEIYTKEIEIEKEIEKEIEIQGETASPVCEKDKIDFELFISEWNQVYGTNIRLTKSKKTQLIQRLKTFSQEEILQAMHKRRHDHWLNNDGKKFLTDWEALFRNDEKIEKYLNAPLKHLQHESNKRTFQTSGDHIGSIYRDIATGR